MKRIFVFICVLVLIALTAVTAFATEETSSVEPQPAEAEQFYDPVLIQEARELYKKCLYASGRDSFSGVCGLMTSYQLWKLGINEKMIVNDGNRQFDAYKNMEVTTGGYDVKAYYAEQYNLEETLNLISHNGTKTVRNILVGFQWTDTEMGAFYGHAVLINAIQDGVVYCTESYDYFLNVMEGQTATCSIAEFAEYFSSWTRYEGCIYFGEKQYANTCESIGTNAFVQLRFDSTLRSQPCLMGENGCYQMRSLVAGEILRTTGIYTNESGDLFYRIDDGQTVGYVSANAVFTLQLDMSGIALDYGIMIGKMSSGGDPPLVGEVTSDGAVISGIRLEVLNATGNTLISVQNDVTTKRASLSTLQEQLGLDRLADGSYQLRLQVGALYATVENGKVSTQTLWQILAVQSLCVGEGASALPTPQQPAGENGWFTKDGVWYCYENGVPCTGWITRAGVSYYMAQDGSVTTGWYREGEKSYYFSETGALCSGWVTTDAGTYYCFSDGTYATGLHTLGGRNYFFAQDGRLQKFGKVTENGIEYAIDAFGVATPAE